MTILWCNTSAFGVLYIFYIFAYHSPLRREKFVPPLWIQKLLPRGQKLSDPPPSCRPYAHLWVEATHGQGEGYGGGDAHRLTPQNTVPLPRAKFNHPNREKMKISKASPSLFHGKPGKFASFSIFFSYWGGRIKKNACPERSFFPPPYPYPEFQKKSPSLSHFL